MNRYATAFIGFKQGIAPDQTSDLVGTDGDIWVDESQTPPVVKKCTSITPYTWVSIEGGGSNANFADAIVPTGSINGTNTSFTLPNSPNPAASLQLFLNGVLQQQGTGKDYTLSGATITMVVAPATGDVLLAWYRF